MANRTQMVLRLLRDPSADETESEVERAAEETSGAPPLHRTVRTYASGAGAVPKGRRIKPPADEPVHEAPAAGGAAEERGELVVPVHRVQELLETYTRFMGPASKRVLDAQLRALGVTPQTLTLDQLPALVKKLASLIDTSEKKRRFLAAMTKVPGAFG